MLSSTGAPLTVIWCTLSLARKPSRPREATRLTLDRIVVEKPGLESGHHCIGSSRPVRPSQAGETYTRWEEAVEYSQERHTVPSD